MQSTLLLINNFPNSYRQGEVIAAYDGRMALTDGIDKRTFENMHPDKKWDRRSVLIRVTDVDVNDPKIKYLLEESTDGLTRRRVFLLPQDASSPYHLALLKDAYIETTIAVIEELTRV